MRLNMHFRTSLQTFTILLLAVLVSCPLYAAKKKTQATPLRVACVGNSVTYGYGLRNRDRDAYPVRLQEMLDEYYGSGRFEVGNFGRSGATLLYKVTAHTSSSLSSNRRWRSNPTGWSFTSG